MILNNNKIIFNNKREIISNYEKLNISKKGIHSNIYKYNDTEILKIFKRKATSEQIEVMNIISTYERDLFSKPILLIEIKNNIVGYTMKFLQGSSLDLVSGNAKIKNIFDFFDEKIDKQMIKLSNDKLEIWDLNYNNLLYDEENSLFHFIDTDCYKLKKSKSSEEIYLSNSLEIISVLLHFLLYKGVFYTTFFEFSKKLLENGINIKKILYTIKDYLENVYDKKIIDLNNLSIAEEILIKKYIK